jgi:hypothetical protein
MEHLQYYHFPSQAQEGAEAMVMLAGDRDRIGCFTYQVNLTRALVWDFEEAVKEVKLLGEHGEESSQKNTELEALCNWLREDAQKLKEVNTKLEGMVRSRDELIAAPPIAVVPPSAPAPPVTTVPEEIKVEEDPVEMVPEQ